MPQNPIRLALAFHNHQPVGNFDGTIEECYQKSYLPFLNLISRPEYSSLKVSLHNSGCLEEWLDRHHPEYLDRLGVLARRGQVEILGGPFQEPILAMLPARDRIGQIQIHSRWIEKRLGVRVRGMWMPERVWEQSCVRDLAEAGMEFTILDDYHFKKAGLAEEKLYGYYLTEDDGKLMAVYPDSEKLRYWIPFDSIERSLNYLRQIFETQENALLFCADDGEKFGAWPQTFEHVYGSGNWLENFFNTLVQNSDWLKTVTMSEARDEVKPLGKCYLPDCSYREMTEWVLDTSNRKEYDSLMAEIAAAEEDCSETRNANFKNEKTSPDFSMDETEKTLLPKDSSIAQILSANETLNKKFRKSQNALRRLHAFVSGGNWRNFKVKYPETNEMYCRMMAVSQRLKTLQDQCRKEAMETSETEFFRKFQLLEDARLELYRGQCNCPYWHGAFGGVYLPHLRNGIFRHLIAADKLMDLVAPNPLTSGDFNFDGEIEYRMESNEISAWIAPANGGMLYELDVRKIGLNLLASMTRQPEPYHEQIIRVIQAQKNTETFTETQKKDPAEKNENGNPEHRISIRENPENQNSAASIKTQADEDLGNIRDKAVFKQDGLENRLQYDLLPRKSLLDQFFAPDVTAERLYSGEAEADKTFCRLPYQTRFENGKLTLAAVGTIRSFEGNPHSISICKIIEINGDALNVTWRLGNLPRWETVLFGVEFNFAGMPGHCDDRFFFDRNGQKLGDLSTCLNTKGNPFLGLADEWQKLRVEMEVSRITDFWTHPIETVSNSEGGFELVHQSVCVIPHWFIRAENDGIWECHMKIQTKVDG